MNYVVQWVMANFFFRPGMYCGGKLCERPSVFLVPMEGMFENGMSCHLVERWNDDLPGVNSF